MTSTSRLTGSPGCLKPSVVRARVSGISETVKSPAVAVETVDHGQRDAVDGDRALVDEVAAQSPAGSETSTSSQCSDGLPAYDGPGAVDVPLHDVAAEPAGAVTARSRFTRAPGSSAPSEVLSRVSRITSAVNVSPSRSATVRQQPLTAIESPEPGVGDDVRAAHGEPDGVALVLERLDDAELLDDAGEHQAVSFLAWGHGEPHVGVRAVAERGHVDHVEVQRVGDRADAEVADGAEPGPEQHRRDVADDLVDEAGREEGRRQGRPALEEHVLPVAGEQRGERLVRVAGAQHHGLGGVVEHPPVRGHVAQPHHRAQRLPVARQGAVVLVADGELRVVDQDGAGADQDRVAQRRAAGGCRGGRPAS